MVHFLRESVSTFISVSSREDVCEGLRALNAKLLRIFNFDEGRFWFPIKTRMKMDETSADYLLK